MDLLVQSNGRLSLQTFTRAKGLCLHPEAVSISSISDPVIVIKTPPTTTASTSTSTTATTPLLAAEVSYVVEFDVVGSADLSQEIVPLKCSLPLIEVTFGGMNCRRLGRTIQFVQSCLVCEGRVRNTELG